MRLCKSKWAWQAPLTYADATGAEPDAAMRAELLDLCITWWRQAPLLRRRPGVVGQA